MPKEKSQVNVEMSVELIGRLDEMCSVDEHNRSQFIRMLIRREWQLRQDISNSYKREKQKNNDEMRINNEKNTSN